MTIDTKKSLETGFFQGSDRLSSVGSLMVGAIPLWLPHQVWGQARGHRVQFVKCERKFSTESEFPIPTRRVVALNTPVGKESLKHLAVAQIGNIARSKDDSEHLQAVAQTGNIARRIINELTENIKNINALLEKLLRDLRRRERTRDAALAILEAVLRATNSPSFSQERPPKKLVYLGVLIRKMGWGDLSESDWDIMSDRYDLEAVDAVFKGMIAVLEIDSERLAAEAAWILEDIKGISSYDLDAIEAALKDTENNSQGFAWALEQIEKFFEEYEGSSLLRKIPQVPVEPRWERAREVELSPDVLERALEHPSEGIVQNAALLLEALRA